MWSSCLHVDDVILTYNFPRRIQTESVTDMMFGPATSAHASTTRASSRLALMPSPPITWSSSSPIGRGIFVRTVLVLSESDVYSTNRERFLA